MKTPKSLVKTNEKGQKSASKAKKPIQLDESNKDEEADQGCKDVDRENEKPAKGLKASKVPERKLSNDCTLLVKNLPYIAQDGDLWALSPDIVEVRLVKRADGKKNRGFGFIEFKDEQTAENNFQVLQDRKVLGRNITVSHTGEKSEQKSKPEDLDPCKLFIAPLDRATETADIEALFPMCKEVILRHKKPPGFGYGLVVYEDADQCKKAMQTVQGTKLKEETLVIEYAKRLKVLTAKEKAAKKKSIRKKNLARKRKAKKNKEAPEAKRTKVKKDDDDNSDDFDEDSDDTE